MRVRLGMQPKFLQSDKLPPWLRYGVTVLAALFATLVTQYVPVIGERAVFLAYLVVILQITLWGGPKPGGVVLALSLPAINTLYLGEHWRSASQDALLLNLAYCAVAGLILCSASRQRSLAVTLWESRMDLNHAQEVGHIGSWRLDVRRNELTWSEENHRIFGIPKGTPLTYEKFLTRVHPADRPYVDRRWEAALGGDTYDIEHRLIVGGEIKWVRERGVLEFDADGQLLGGFGTTQDITENKRAYDALRSSEQRLRQLAEAMPNMVWTCTPAGTCDYLNKQWSEYTGLDVDGSLGYGWQRQVHPDDRESLHKDWERALRTGDPFESEFRIRRHDGLYRWFKARAQPVHDDAGQVIKWYGANTDIHALRETQASLRASEYFKQAVLDALPACIAVLDRHGVIKAVNQAWQCFAEEEGAPEGFRVGVGIDYLAVWRRASQSGVEVAEAVLNGVGSVLQGRCDSFELEYACQVKKPERWVSMNVVKASTEIGGAIVTHLDVTRRKRAELERQRFVALADTSTDFIGMFDINFMPQYVNQAGLSLVGFDDSEQALQTSVPAFFFPEDRSYICEVLLPRVLGDGRAEGEIRFRHVKTGAPIWMTFAVFLIRDENGTPEGFATISRDITGRKQNEMALQEREATLRLAIKGVDAGLWDRNFDDHSVYWSPEWKSQIGYADTDLPNRWEEWVDRIHPADRDEVLALTDEFITGRRSAYELEYRLRHRDGSYRWIHSRAVLLCDNKQRPYRMLGMNFDVTVHKKSQELRALGAELEESFRLYVAIQTAAAIAHELNQPLSAIASYTNVVSALVRAGVKEGDKLIQILEKCEQQALRAGRVTRQLLSLLQRSQAESGPFDLGDMIREALALLKVDTDLDGCKVVTHLAPGMPLVHASRPQVEKVLLNLFRNALDSMQDRLNHSAVLLVRTNYPAEENMVQVTVADTGQGIDPENQKLIFQPFFTTKARGLGMGLVISRSLIEAQGGRLWFETDSGCGARFHFTLPVAS